MNKKIIFGVGGALLVAIIVFTLVVFQPHRLFFDDVVEEARPESVVVQVDEMMKPKDPFVTDTTTTPADTPADTAGGVAGDTEPPVAQTLSGDFISLDHPTSGIAEVIPTSPSERVLRLENFQTDNGPDLFVYLTTAPADGSEPFDVDFVDLGRLKGNIGSQNYDIPADVNLAEYSTVVIWCSRFTSAFGAAEMTPR